MNQEQRMREARELVALAEHTTAEAAKSLASVAGAEELRRRLVLINGELDTAWHAIEHERAMLFPEKAAAEAAARC